jgi:hypothetical protein
MAFAAWQATIVDDAGNVQENASIEVLRDIAGQPPAQCYSDRNGTDPIGSTFNADSDGFVRFFVAGGAYQITATLGAFSRVWRYVAIGTAGETDLAGITPVGAAGTYLRSDGVGLGWAPISLDNEDWLTGRNAGDDADLNMFRVNEFNYTEFENPIFYDNGEGFNDRHAIFSIERHITTIPTDIFPNIWSLAQGRGDNTNFVGVAGADLRAYDNDDITALTKGCLYALQLVVRPLVERNNSPFDDVVGINIVNVGTVAGVEAIFVGEGSSPIVGNHWQAIIGNNADSECVLRSTGTHDYGIDFFSVSPATFNQAAIRIPNNTTIVARNSGGDGDLPIAIVDGDDIVIIGDGIGIVPEASTVFVDVTTFSVGSTSVFFDNIPTTASAANANLDAANSNRLRRSTSSGAFKRNVEDIESDRVASVISALRPVWFRSDIPTDRQDWSWYGLIAEEVAAVDPRLAEWGYNDDDYEAVSDENGKQRRRVGRRLKPDATLKPVNVAYSHVGVFALAAAQRGLARIAEIETRLTNLENEK